MGDDERGDERGVMGDDERGDERGVVRRWVVSSCHYARLCIHVYIHVYACMSIYAYIYISMCIYTCIHIAKYACL